MQQSELTTKLMQAWANWCGFCGDDETFTPPDRFWTYLAQQITEWGAVETQQDTDVVRVRVFGGEWIPVRLTGHKRGTLIAQRADHIGGIMICPVRDVHPDDEQKLADILDRLEGGQ